MRRIIVWAGFLIWLCIWTGHAWGAGLQAAGRWSVVGRLNSATVWDESQKNTVAMDTWTVIGDGTNLDLTSVNLKGAHIKGIVTPEVNGGHYEGWVYVEPVVAGIKTPLAIHYIVDVYLSDNFHFYGTEAIYYYGAIANNPAYGWNPVPTSETWKLIGTRL